MHGRGCDTRACTELAVSYVAMFVGLLWAGWVVGNILSVIQGIDRQQQDVNTKKVSKLIRYATPATPYAKVSLTAVLCLCARLCCTSKYGANISRQGSVALMKWAESCVTITVEDVLADLPKGIRNATTQAVYQYDRPPPPSICLLVQLIHGTVHPCRSMVSSVKLLSGLPEELQTEVLVAGHYMVANAAATVFARGAIANSLYAWRRRLLVSRRGVAGVSRVVWPTLQVHPVAWRGQAAAPTVRVRCGQRRGVRRAGDGVRAEHVHGGLQGGDRVWGVECAWLRCRACA